MLDRFIAIVESVYAQGAFLGRPYMSLSCGERLVPVHGSFKETIKGLHRDHPEQTIEAGMLSADRVVVLSLCGEEILESSWNRDAGPASAGGRALPNDPTDEIARELLWDLHWHPIGYHKRAEAQG